MPQISASTARTRNLTVDAGTEGMTGLLWRIMMIKRVLRGCVISLALINCLTGCSGSSGPGQGAAGANTVPPQQTRPFFADAGGRGAVAG